MPEGEGTTRTLETPEPGENEWGDEDGTLQVESDSEELEEEESPSSDEEIEENIGDKGDAESSGSIISGMDKTTVDESTESISDGEGTVGDSGGKDDNASEFVRSIRMKPFFGPDTKYGYCPYCAAVIIFNERVISLDNESNIVKCHNCEAKLEVKMENLED